MRAAHHPDFRTAQSTDSGVKVDVMVVKDRPGKKSRNSRQSDPEGTGAGGGPAAEGQEVEGKEAARRRKTASSSLAVESRRQRYMITPLPQPLLPPGVAELGMDAVCDRLASMPDVTVLCRLQPSQKLQTAGVTPSCPEIAVVEAAEVQLPALQALHVHIEPDLPLTAAGSAAMPAGPGVPALRDPGLVMPLEEAAEVVVRVCGPGGEPLAGVGVFLVGAGWPAQGITTADGTATIRLVTDTPQSVQALYVRPRGGYVDRWINRPELSTAGENLITLTPLATVYPELEDRQSYGWGQQAMRLDRLPPTFRGFGIKIAVIGSGVSIDHPDLKQRVRAGIDLVHGTKEGWAHDSVGSGTHTAGIIAGADTGKGMVGIAVDADLEVCQVLPDGHFSDLITALDHCIDRDIDIAHIAIATPYLSTLISRKLADATAAGVACIAPTGDTGGPVSFPACLPTVYAVSAVGAFGTCPPDTSHATHTGPQLTPEGVFDAPFGNGGPGVDAAAPGVAVLSCAPETGYTVLDGTAVASAHIAGLAALVLAHHEVFHGRLLPRGPARIQHLFDIITASCRPLAAPETPDAARTGRGLPDALTALGLAPGMQLAPALAPFMAPMPG
ncbi:S8 family serine peptidase [Streptomyces sp900105245]|uniref:S8 family serine peptidase n=1 Tax=Streptomyces sp. 900105245 TaxID=3154379 RepID=A0ABV1ULG8_9ACTN